MRTYAYAAAFEPGDEGSVVVSFPDVPEAITQGDNDADARVQAADALALALLTYLKQGRTLPEPCSTDGRVISVHAKDAAKIAVVEAFRAVGITKSELGRRIGKDEREVRRILDPMHASKLGTLNEALAALGRRLVIGVEELAA